MTVRKCRVDLATMSSRASCLVPALAYAAVAFVAFGLLAFLLFELQSNGVILARPPTPRTTAQNAAVAAWFALAMGVFALIAIGAACALDHDGGAGDDSENLVVIDPTTGYYSARWQPPSVIATAAPAGGGTAPLLFEGGGGFDRPRRDE